MISLAESSHVHEHFLQCAVETSEVWLIVVRSGEVQTLIVLAGVQPETDGIIKHSDEETGLRWLHAVQTWARSALTPIISNMFLGCKCDSVALSDVEVGNVSENWSRYSYYWFICPDNIKILNASFYIHGLWKVVRHFEE